MKTKPEDSVYVKGLVWAYERQGRGFTKEEFREALQITDPEWDIVEWLFFNGISHDSPLIWTPLKEYLRHGQIWGDIMHLSPSGMSAAVDYLELKEAQKSGRNAMRIAIFTVVISIAVGLAQIYFDVRNVPSSVTEDTPAQEEPSSIPIPEESYQQGKG